MRGDFRLRFPSEGKGERGHFFLCVTGSSYVFTSFFYRGTVTLLYILLVESY